MKENDLQKRLSAHGLNENTPPYAYIQWLTQLTDSSDGIREPHENAPFLSVIVRTQGKRTETLKEALHSLEGQTDGDFEILLVVHNADAKGKAAVNGVLETLPPAFRARIRREELTGGNRTAPLNFGAARARGTYFAMLDDDDLVYENWVEVFHQGADAHSGRVIRCYGCTQVWQTLTQEDGSVRSRPYSSVKNEYCEPFDLLAQLQDNRTPISCVAIPSLCFHTLGLRFDETLTTSEDWDYIMRASLTVGLHDTEKVTFLYRLWENTESSRTLHDADEWTRNRETVAKKLNGIPILTDRQVLLQGRLNALSRPQTGNGTPRPCTFGAFCKQTVTSFKRYLQFKRNARRYLQALRESELFDPTWYLEQNPDVKSAGLDPARHYLMHGWLELRDPSPIFSTARYLAAHPNTDLCPLIDKDIRKNK